jgi:hypothetical protein
VRLHAIKLCSFKEKGEARNTQPLIHRFVAESSCFCDGEAESLEEDSTALLVADSCLAGTPEIYSGSAAREMILDIEAATKDVAVGQWPKTPADEKNCVALVQLSSSSISSIPKALRSQPKL